MTRFEGAVTSPGEPTDSSAPPRPERPPRPLLLEISAAILIVGGLTSLLATLAGATSRGAGAAPVAPVPIVVLFVVVNVLTILVGLLIRNGRAWILALNVVAVGLFLDFTALPSPIAALYLVFDTVAFVALIRHRWWFEWRADDETTRPAREGQP